MRKLLFLFLFCHAFLSNAQENYKTGFVVKNNGDTLRGSIDYKNWGKNSREVAFKTAANTVQQVFSYRNIRAFGCEASAKDWEYYESFSVDIEKSPYLLNDLNRDRKLYFQHDTLFLQLLLNAQGRINWRSQAPGQVL